ncbi:LysE family translocator [Tianweitania populi]|uniref:Threonine efflux protein n=1 Tax=Tianweitania populi TaxID=1607949 RepID=A0A8J3DLZ8_9HYPH|nr:LysE family transporter [Tianweitania populi]GHD05210.1 threonine efflux protein [Tianweitania populi]
MWQSLAVQAEASSLLGYAAAYAAMLVTPGPSFAVVSQTSLSASRREATTVAIGLACGASLLILLILRGTTSLRVSQALGSIGPFIGTALLLLIGLRTVRRALLAEAANGLPTRQARQGNHFTIGLLTALTNPISFAFFSSIALAAHSAKIGMIDTVLPAGVFLMALSWFGLVAVLLSLPSVKKLYGRASRTLDVMTGMILIIIALSWLAT